MADDRMRNDDRERNMGGANKHKDDYGKGQQTPGRHQQDDDMSAGKRGAGQQGEQRNKDDDFGKSGDKNAAHEGRDV